MELFDLNGNALSFYQSIRNRDRRFEIDFSDATLIEVLQARMRYLAEKGMRTSGLKTVISNIRVLESQELKEGDAIYPEDVTDIFYSIFANYKSQTCVNETIQSYCIQIRTALKWAAKHHAKLSSTFDEFNFPTYNNSKVALTTSEVTRIGYFDIQRTLKGVRRPQYIRKMEKVRDMFVLACNLGQRYSDMVAITPECFERNVFRIKQKKTGNIAVVNIDTFAVDKQLTYEILKRYDYHAPTTIDISGYNKTLKELMKLIGGTLAEEVSNDRKVMGEMRREIKRRYELIASHSARRSFISINVFRKHPEYQIRRCSGHVDSRSFNRYICLGEDE